MRPGYLAMAFLVGGTLVSSATPMAALARTQTIYTIGVDNAGPPGHDFEYVDYFPRDGVKVHAGDVVDFSWNPGSPDGAHTATFLPRGTGVPPIAIPAPTGDEPGLQFNPDILFPTDPTCGASKANPCVYDGTRVVNSGFIFDGNPTPPYFSDFFVKLDAKLLQGGATTDVPYFCDIHPGMVGSLTLVSDSQDASDPVALHGVALRQLNDDTAGALNAEKSANSSLVVRNSDGTSSVTVTAGTATPYVEVAEMLPSTVSIKPGDTINWVTKTIKDPHTVTFPRGPASQSVDPLPAFCEAKPTDTLPSDMGPPCPNIFKFRAPLLASATGGSSDQRSRYGRFIRSHRLARVRIAQSFLIQFSDRRCV